MPGVCSSTNVTAPPKDLQSLSLSLSGSPAQGWRAAVLGFFSLCTVSVNQLIHSHGFRGFSNDSLLTLSLGPLGISTWTAPGEPQTPHV